jgi:hypothetical protein
VLLGSNGGSFGIAAPAWAQNKKGPLAGAFGWSRMREARGGVAATGILDARLSGAHAKKPGAGSRPGTLREFQFRE